MIVLGRIVAPFGIKGWVKIMPFGDDPMSWADMPQWWIAKEADAPDEAWRAVTLRECRAHGTGLAAQVDECDDRNAAEALKGWYVAAPRDALPAPDENEYYWGDLIGLSVENLAGEQLGIVTGLLSTGAHDVLQIADGDTERLIPFVANYAIEVDMTARMIRVDWHKDW